MCKSCAGLPEELVCGEGGTESAAKGGLVCDGAFSQSLPMTACTRFETIRRSSANRQRLAELTVADQPALGGAFSSSLTANQFLRQSGAAFAHFFRSVGLSDEPRLV